MKSQAAIGSPSGTCARVAPSPPRGGRGGCRFCFPGRGICTNFSPMNFDAIISQLTDFFSTGVGKTIADVLWTIYTALFPANAEAAFPIEIPR